MTETDSLDPCSPFFTVSNMPRVLTHYVERLGFESRFEAPDAEPFFAIVGRGSAQIVMKSVGETVAPLPNHRRHDWAPWDAFIHAPDPDALAREFTGRAVEFHHDLGDRDDGLRGFEVADPDGYVCFFSRPRGGR